MKIFAILTLLIFGFSGCSLPRGAAINSEILSGASQENAGYSVVAVNRENLEDISKWAVTGWAGHYRWLATRRGPASVIIQTGDTLDLVIWDSDLDSLLTPVGQNTATMPGIQVSPSGTIFLPYIGEIFVRGLTASQAREEVRNSALEFSPAVQVQLQVKPGQASIVDLVTGVPRPGRLPLASRNITILSVIAEGGGISPALENPLVRLVRASNTYEIRADELLSNGARNITMRGGDKVIIEEDNRYFVGLGATGSEKLVYFDREHITTIEALSMLGGLVDDRANLQGVLILREYPEAATNAHRERGPDQSRVIFTFDLTTAEGLFAARQFRVNPKDTIIATESAVGPAHTAISLVLGLIRVGGNF